MDQLLTDNVWGQLQEFFDPNLRKQAAIAYVSSNKYLSFIAGDILICDASDQAIKFGETNARLLQRFWKSGVELYSLSNLHAKVVVFGKQDYVLVGSTNLSISSAENLRELALLSDNSQIIAQALAFIHTLKPSATPIDKDFISRIIRIKVKRKSAKHRAERKSLKRLGNRKWIVSVRELKENAFENEKIFMDVAFDKLNEESESKAAEKTLSHISWLRFTGKSKFRREATAGDIVLLIFEDLQKNICLFEPTVILFRQDHDHWTRFYYEHSPNMSICDWGIIQKELQNQGLAYITKNSIRELKVEEFNLLKNILT